MWKKLLPYVKGLSRHGLTIVGGSLVMFGVLSEAQSVEIMGYITSLIAVAQSVSSSAKEEFAQRFQGVIRHILTFFGGLGVLKGWYGSEQFLEIGSALSIAAGTIWSLLSKKDQFPLGS